MVNACNIHPHQARTNANDKMTVKDYIFLQNIMHREKYSNIKCTEWWIPGKRCRISIVRYGSVIRGCGSQTRGAGSEIRWDPSQFNRCCTNIYRIVNTPLVSTHLHSRIRKRVFRTSVCVQFVFVCWERAFTLPGHIMPNSHRPPDTTRQSCLCSVRRCGVWVSFKSRITWMAHGIV